MIKQFIFCNWCEADLTNEKGFIVIDGKIHYCDVVCEKMNQDNCDNMTDHKNSVKDESQGKCFDCGISYAELNL